MVDGVWTHIARAVINTINTALCLISVRVGIMKQGTSSREHKGHM
jgi:hypothetical protein